MEEPKELERGGEGPQERANTVQDGNELYVTCGTLQEERN
jgi:hypothetical protein